MPEWMNPERDWPTGIHSGVGIPALESPLLAFPAAISIQPFTSPAYPAKHREI